MVVLDSLQAISGYPLSRNSLKSICIECEVDANQEIDAECIKSANYKKAKAEVFLMLSQAPNISQGGVSYNFSQEERESFKANYYALMNEIGEEANLKLPKFGYKGTNL